MVIKKNCLLLQQGGRKKARESVKKMSSSYLNKQKKYTRIVQISRIFLLLAFLFIWEFSANIGLIDSFIFSSPSKIALCFWDMLKDHSIFTHIGVTLYETIVSFAL